MSGYQLAPHKSANRHRHNQLASGQHWQQRASVNTNKLANVVWHRLAWRQVIITVNNRSVTVIVRSPSSSPQLAGQHRLARQPGKVDNVDRSIDPVIDQLAHLQSSTHRQQITTNTYHRRPITVLSPSTSTINQLVTIDNRPTDPSTSIATGITIDRSRSM